MSRRLMSRRLISEALGLQVFLLKAPAGTENTRLQTVQTSWVSGRAIWGRG
jgi:hypothetical protein